MFSSKHLFTFQIKMFHSPFQNEMEWNKQTGQNIAHYPPYSMFVYTHFGHSHLSK